MRSFEYCVLAACCGFVFSIGSLPAQLIETVDYSDTFTVAEQGGVAQRIDGTYDTGSPAYDVEDSHGNPTATWTPSAGFSFNTGGGTACCSYPGNEGNDEAATGLAQSGGGDFSFAYGLRTDYVVELDAILPLDRLDISSVPSPGAGIGSSPSLSVFLRLDSVAGTPHGAFPETGLPGIGLFNGTKETAVLDVAGNLVEIGVDDAKWHKFAVHFNQDSGFVRCYVDGAIKANIDLNTFGGGIYRDFSNAAVGAGGSGYDFATRVLWVDNFQVGAPEAPDTEACFSASPTSGVPPLAVDFDASCSFFSGSPESYSWDFGDAATGSGETTQHTYNVGGKYMVTLSVKDTNGQTSSATKTITVFEAVTSYSDDFERPDGPIDGWTVYSVPGGWNISGGELVTGPTAEERFIWAGDPPVFVTTDATYTWSQIFAAPGTDTTVGRHAGFVFCANKPTHRFETGVDGFTGYFVDWIDRVEDRGLRFTRVDRGVLTELIRGDASGLPMPADPPLEWSVEVQGEMIRLYGDGTLYFEVADATYRGGLFGFWSWAGGQEVAFDELTVTSDPLSACFSFSPPLPVMGAEVAFDATCSAAAGQSISGYQWDFADGGTASGATVTHTYAFPGQYGLTLTVTAGALTDTFQQTVTVSEVLTPLADCFDRTAGPVDGWTAALGDWAITAEGKVETTTAAAEAFLYAGDPPLSLPPKFVAEVDWTFVAATPVETNGIGRHAGINFFWNLPTADRFAADSRGYNLFYIDRADDRGLNLLRFQRGGYVVLNPQPGTPEITEPPAKVRIEVGGRSIKVYADGVLAIDVEDETYRDGYFGLFAYNENQVQFDNVLIGVSELPSCGGPQKPIFRRGDPNGDGTINITDGIYVLNFLFLGGPKPTCQEAANPNDDATVNITDGIYILNFLFLGGPVPVAPGHMTCGPDPDGSLTDLGCETYTKC